MLTSFALAVQFLTRIPLSINITVTDERLGQSVLFYPLVGLLIGLFLLLLTQLLPEHLFALNAAIILSVWVLLTGGLHLDGLADCSDAWAGGLNNKQCSLKIMQDPAIGSVAVIILLLVLLLKWIAIQNLLQADLALSFLMLAPFLGRLSILMLMLSTPYISENGLGSAMQQHLPRSAARLIVCVSLLLCFWLTSIYILLSMILLIYCIRYLAIQRIQGVTGDVYGASVELVEAIVLVSLTLLYG